jgi:hypothetical protein
MLVGSRSSQVTTRSGTTDDGRSGFRRTEIDPRKMRQGKATVGSAIFASALQSSPWFCVPMANA